MLGGGAGRRKVQGSEKSEEGRWGSSETLPEKEMRTWAQVGETDVGREEDPSLGEG